MQFGKITWKHGYGKIFQENGLSGTLESWGSKIFLKDSWPWIWVSNLKWSCLCPGWSCFSQQESQGSTSISLMEAHRFLWISAWWWQHSELCFSEPASHFRGPRHSSGVSVFGTLGVWQLMTCHPSPYSVWPPWFHSETSLSRGLT